MDNLISFLQTAPLFSGLAEPEIRHLVNCLNVQKETYPKGSVLWEVGQSASRFGLLLTGSVSVLQDDFWGNRSLMVHVEAGGLFAEDFAMTDDQPTGLSVLAESDCSVLWLNAPRLLSVCREACPFHVRLIENLLIAFAQQNRLLSERMSHISKRTTRQKLLSYLSDQARRSGSDEFCIPFNRQQLADYLSVDRSAMSVELSRLKADGVIRCRRNRFTLLRSPF